MNTTEAQSLGSLERMVRRLATRGLLPCEHNLSIWQHADNSGWGASVETPYRAFSAEGHGETIEAALEALMRETNRGADVKPPNEKAQAQPPTVTTGRKGDNQ